MTYSPGEAGAEGPKAPNLLLLRETRGGSFFIPKDGSSIPASLYDGDVTQPSEENTRHKDKPYLVTPLSQAIVRLHHKDASKAREVILGVSGRVKESEEGEHPLIEGEPPKKAAVLHSELKCASLENCLERAGL